MEWSVKFNFEADEVVVGMLLLEGERKIDERLTTIESEKQQIDNVPPADLPADDVEIPVVVPEAAEGRGKRVRKELNC